MPASVPVSSMLPASSDIPRMKQAIWCLTEKIMSPVRLISEAPRVASDEGEDALCTSMLHRLAIVDGLDLLTLQIRDRLWCDENRTWPCTECKQNG